MKKDRKYLIFIGLCIILIIVLVVIKNSNSQEKTQENQINQGTEQNTNQNASKPQNDSEKINITQEQLKNSIEKTENGITISDVKLNSNANNIIKIQLNAKNANKENRNVQLSVTYYNANNEKIGENGFSIGIMDPNQAVDMESTCYISEKDVKSIKIDIKADEIKSDEAKKEQ